MSDNKDLGDRVNELERAKLQKRIAELEADLGAKPNVKDEPVGRVPGQEMWKTTPITKKTLKQNKVYQLGETLFLLLPLFAFAFYFFKGGITLWNISSENFNESFREILPYLAGGFVLYLIIMELIWNIIIHIFLGRMKGGKRIRRNQGIKPVNPVAQSAIPKTVGTYLIVTLVVVAAGFTVFQAGKVLLPKIGINLPGVSGAIGNQYWKGAFPVTLTQYGYGNVQELANNGGNGVLTFQPWIEWSGVPWMVLMYDKVSQKVTMVLFGLSEVTYKVVNGTMPEDLCTVKADDIQGVDKYKLDLKGCILVIPANSQITNGVQQFSFTDALGTNGFTFVYTSDQMEGSATILKEDHTTMPYSSEQNAIKLYRK
jgi:hypothetical protein